MTELLLSAPAETFPGALRRSLVIGLIGFLTLVDLFATQAILPALALEYGVSPSAIGVAANASTIGMAIAGLLVGGLARDVDRRTGVWLSLALLAVPTVLLASAPSLTVFALLRIAQGLCMASAFTLTLAYLGERCSRTDAAGALAAYVTGGVASNLVGRLCAATVASYAGVGATFYVFAALNLAGAVLAYTALSGAASIAATREPARPIMAAWGAHLSAPDLRRAYAIGFLILFGFIGTFTYVGFVLAAPPLALSMMATGLVFFVFLPSMVTTPMAGDVVNRIGARRALPASLLVALAGLALLIVPRLEAVIAGLVLVGIGTFFAQAVATGYVGRAAARDRAAASGLYLSFYYGGGLVGAALIGQLFDRLGWNAAVAGIFAALALAAWLGRGLSQEDA
jgi:MFS transporter, YNFM family, putative membrane transport protein